MRRLVAIVAVLAALVFGGFSSPRPTHADLAADQLSMLDYLGTVYSACVYGVNQYGTPTHNCWSTPGFRTDFSNWWWENPQNVDVFLYDYWGYYINQSFPTIAVIHNWVNWWCFSDSTADGHEGYPTC